MYVLDSDILVGRTQYLQRFRAVLAEKRSRSHVFFVSGEGGCGKSRLIREFQAIAKNEPAYAGQWQILSINWEDERQPKGPINSRPGRVQPKTVFEIIVEKIERQLSATATTNYNEAQDDLKKVRWQIGQALANEKPDGQFELLIRLGAENLEKLIRTGGQWIPPFPISKTPHELVVLARNFLYGCLEKVEDYNIFCEPYRCLSDPLSQDLSALNSDPILICLDNYQFILDEVVDYCLQRMIQHSGPHIVWVITCRYHRSHLNLLRFFENQDAHSILVEDMPLASLTKEEIKDYFDHSSLSRPLSEAQADKLLTATGGIPLALTLAAEMWRKGVAFENITEGRPFNFERQELVTKMVDRFFKQCVEPHAVDRDAIYLLAMMRRPDFRFFQPVLLRKSEQQKAVEDRYQDLPQLKRHLARRYSFISPSGMLDDGVLQFLREHLLSPRSDIEARNALSHTGCQLLADKIEQITRQESMPLWERWSNSDWVEATLDLVHFKFWYEDEWGWREFIPRFLEALAYGCTHLDALLEIVRFFASYFSREDQRRFYILDQSQQEEAGVQEQRELVQELDKLNKNGWLNGSSRPEYEQERQAILEWLKGEWYLTSGDYPQALACYQDAEQGLALSEVADLRQKFAHAHLAVAQAFIWPMGREEAVTDSESNLKQAEQATQNALKLGLKQTSDTYYTLAICLSGLEQHDTVIEFVDHLDPTDFEHQKLLGLAYRQVGRIEKAKETLEKASTLNSDDDDTHFRLGQIYYELGATEDKQYYQKARGAYQRVTELKPEEPLAHSGLGDSHFMLEAYPQAKTAYEKTTELMPDNAKAYANLANAYVRQQTWQAINAYQKACELDPTWAYPYYQLGKLYLQVGKFDNATTSLQKAVQLGLQDVQVRYWLGTALYELGEHAQAHDVYHEALMADKQSALAHYGKGRALLALHQLQEAPQALQEAPQALQESPQKNNYSFLNHPPKALQKTTKALQEAPQGLQAAPQGLLLQEVQDQASQGLQGAPQGLQDAPQGLQEAPQGLQDAPQGLQDARQALQKAVGLAPKAKEKTFRYYLAEAHYKLREYDAARATCQKALTSSPKEAPLYCLLGDVNREAKEYDEAIAAYEQALKFISLKKWAHLPWALVYSKLGELYYLQEKMPKSITAYTEALQRAPDDALLYHYRGWSYYVSHRYQDAIADFERALAQDSTLLQSSRALGAVYLSLRELEQSKKFYQQAIGGSKEQHLITHLSLGAICLDQGDQQLAEDHLGQVIQKYEHSTLTAGVGERCCYTLAQLALMQLPMVRFQNWSNDLRSVQDAGAHHYLRQWLAIGELLAERVTTHNLKRYLVPLQDQLKQTGNL